MKRLAPLALAFGLAVLLAGPALAENENEKNYGKCRVVTERDDFTDKISYHWLFCLGDAAGGERFEIYALSLHCGVYPFNGVGFKAGTQFHLNGQIRIQYRWGKEKAQSGNWEWGGNVAIQRSANATDRFLKAMTRTNRLIFQVGKNKGIVKITEAERAAIPDFKARCGKE